MIRYAVRPRAPTDVVELTSSFLRHLGPRAARDDSAESSCLDKRVGISMYATIRRYEAVDQSRSSELVNKAKDSLVPRLTELPGFNGYFLIETGKGVISSVGFFDTPEHAEESTSVAANWVREEKLETALPNPPKITRGEVIVHETRELVQA